MMKMLLIKKTAVYRRQMSQNQDRLSPPLSKVASKSVEASCLSFKRSNLHEYSISLKCSHKLLLLLPILQQRLEFSVCSTLHELNGQSILCINWKLLEGAFLTNARDLHGIEWYNSWMLKACLSAHKDLPIPHLCWNSINSYLWLLTSRNSRKDII